MQACSRHATASAPQLGRYVDRQIEGLRAAFGVAAKMMVHAGRASQTHTYVIAPINSCTQPPGLATSYIFPTLTYAHSTMFD